MWFKRDRTEHSKIGVKPTANTRIKKQSVMAGLKVPKSRWEKLDEKALKIQADYQSLLDDGKGPWQSKKAIMRKYKIGMTSVYNYLNRAERLTSVSHEG